jgi:signal transduction histidine kinase
VPPPPPAESRGRKRLSWQSILRWRGTTPIMMTALAGMVVLAGLWFSNSEGLRDTAAQSEIGIRAEEVLSAAAATRNEAAQALLVSSVVSDPADEALMASLGLLNGATDRLLARSEALAAVAEGSHSIREATTAFADEVHAFGELLADRQAADDVSLFTTNLEPAYRDFLTVVAPVRDRALQRIALEQSSAGRLATAARLFVAVVIPVTLVVGFRLASVRRQRRKELEVSLKHERTLNRVKDEAIANLSHELRTPLTSIQGFALAMLDDEILTNPESAREMVEIVASEAVELGRMIEDLLTAARSEAGALDVQLAPTDIRFEVDAVLEPLLATGAYVRSDVRDAKVMVDHLRLRQILRNLISNAIKHGGGDVQVNGLIDGGDYVVEVSDAGDGVPKHVADRLFTRFVHEGEAPLTMGSVGLGLSITRELAEMMSGTVRYLRRDDRTIFALKVPLA